MFAKSKELIIIIVIFAVAGVLFFFGLVRYKTNIDERNKAASEANQKIIDEKESLEKEKEEGKTEDREKEV